MISRRTVMKYTGLAWLGGIASEMFGHEVIEITDGPYGEGHRIFQTGTLLGMLSSRDGRPQRIMPGDETPLGWSVPDPWRPITSMGTWMPKDGQVVLLATTGGGDAIWLATFHAARDDTLHGKPLHTTWCFVTLENKNELWPGGLGKYSWMELPCNPYANNGEWDHADLTDPPLPEPRTAEQYEKSVYYPDGSKRT